MPLRSAKPVTTGVELAARVTGPGPGSMAVAGNTLKGGVDASTQDERGDPGYKEQPRSAKSWNTASASWAIKSLLMVIGGRADQLLVSGRSAIFAPVSSPSMMMPMNQVTPR